MKDLTVSPTITIKQAMKNIDQTAEKCLLVVDEELKLLGTLTDGDIRRAILGGNKFSDAIQEFYNKKPITVNSNNESKNDIKEIFLKNKVGLIPVVDGEFKLAGYKTWESVIGNEAPRKNHALNVPVVIMAGGKGSRLEPFTKILPKPLVPINEKPIIEHIIEKFTDVGCLDFYLTVNYKGKILKAYFEELSPKYSVSFIEELKPLGTAGSLRYLDGRFDGPFFVTNCDILVKSDYSAIFEFHNKGAFDITLVASAKEYEIPYGTCKLNSEGHLSHIDEKPNYDFLINTGLYVLNPDILELIPNKKFFHITTLIEKVKRMGKKVGVFPVEDDSWIDIGQWAEYKSAIKKL